MEAKKRSPKLEIDFELDRVLIFLFLKKKELLEKNNNDKQ